MIGQRLKLARSAAGLSLRELETKIGNRVSAQALSKYEQDEMMPSSDVLIALSGATGGMLSGIIAAQTGFGAMALGGGILSLLLIAVVVWSLRGRDKQAAA